MNETPLSTVGYGDFLELVVRNHVRPQRPDEDEVPELSDEVWDLAERCWTHIAKKRPIASRICDDIAHLLHTRQTVPHPTISRSSPEPETTAGQAQIIDGGSSNWLPSPSNLTAVTNIFSASFSPDGKYIAASTGDSKSMVLDAQTGVPIWGPLSDIEQPRAVAFSPDGKRVAFCARNIVIRDVLTGHLVVQFTTTDSIKSVSFSPDGKKLATGNGKGIQVWDAWTGDLILGPLGHSMYICPIALSGDGKHLVSGSNGDLPISIWDTKSGRLVRSFKANLSPNHFVAFSPDGKRVISSSQEGDSCVWDLDSGALICGPSKRHAEGTLAVLFTPASGWQSWVSVVSPDGKWIITATLVNTFEIWNSKTGLLATTFTESGFIRMLAFSLDSKQILVIAEITMRTYHLDR